MNSPDAEQKLNDTKRILELIGMPREQINDRTGLTLLALLDLTPEKEWSKSRQPLIGISPIMQFARDNYLKDYAPNTRETFRRYSMHQLVAAGVVMCNPDDPSRPVNSPKTVYQVEPGFYSVILRFSENDWADQLSIYMETKVKLVDKYAREREQVKIPVNVSEELVLKLSSGEHSVLIKDIIESFGPRYAPGSKLLYVGDTGVKWGYFDKELLTSLNVMVDSHGKMPDVVLYDSVKNWLFLIESVTSHGPVDGKRYDELSSLFGTSSAGLVYVTAFPNRHTMAKYLPVIAWETEVWLSDNPSHLIHLNGDRFMGPRT